MTATRRAPHPCGRARRRAVGAGALAALLASVLACTATPPRSPDDAEVAPAEPAPPQPEASEPTPALAGEAEATGGEGSAESASAGAPASSSSEFDQDIADIEKMAGIGPNAPDDTPRGREIVYRVSSGELTVDLGGLTLKPKARAVRRDNGSYGVELEVVAESKDGQQYWLSSPSKRPLSIAGEILVRADEAQRFGDERRGEGELLVPSNSTRTFRQTWPGKGQPKLWGGQKATLEVGLWGVHGDDERERPVKRLFLVKLSASARPTALIMPPDVVGSE